MTTLKNTVIDDIEIIRIPARVTTETVYSVEGSYSARLSLFNFTLNRCIFARVRSNRRRLSVIRL